MEKLCEVLYRTPKNQHRTRTACGLDTAFNEQIIRKCFKNDQYRRHGFGLMIA